MNKFMLTMATAVTLLLSACTDAVEKTMPEYNKGINIIPKPLSLTEHGGEFELGKSAELIAQGAEARTIAEFFATKMRASTGYKLPVVEGEQSAEGSIFLRIDPSLKLKEEGYTLEVKASGVEVVGRSAHGLFYGMQTLMQLLPAEIESRSLVRTVYWKAPVVSVQDEPAFGYRGLLIDVCRHFLTVEDVKRQIDVLSMFKVNRMHWHLTEDQGWRIEIKKYPRLTEIGSKRIEGDGSEYGGFYTQEQIKEVVRYAQERFVTIIPEIELPGHAMGAISAYPELACNPKTQAGQDYKVRNLWGVELDVYCAGKEEVFEFLSDVIDEVAPLFPGEYFHIGGDECPKDRWKVCPLCQKRIKQEKLKDEHELQSYVIRRAQKMLDKHGKKLIGWDEILEGGLAPSATVMSWRGESGGIASANMGHDVIMTPGSGGLYIDHYQGDPKIEPVAICCYSPLEKVYSYYPVPETIAEDKRHHILGAQANLWGEYLYDTRTMEYRAYPRLQALAELTWTPVEKKDFADFSRRINNAYVRLDHVGVNYHIPLPEQPKGSCDFIAFVDSTQLTLKTTRPIKMVYTLDGSEPTASSTEYSEPLLVTESKVIKVASVLPSGKLSRVREITFEKQELSPAVELKKPVEGLLTRRSMGNYLKASDFANATNWVEGKAERLERVKPHGLKNNMDEFDASAVIGEGYVLIPEDGVYFFSTDNDEFWIDGKKIIDNAGEVKKFSRHDCSVALKAGYHPIKVVFIGAVHGGFPTYWSDSSVYMRAEGADKFTPITSFIAK
ncbi:family 20 glycosylhydrolase [Porphyromonas sp. COT-239 OH1446]|uniref:family 20 glycosylhydrolase n=1 Tax=Porphyromonas sp. COT-239 OH1446 TaxID=1515613 RepID=UPI00052BE609|nr:family 20 glycosylhydrolase [Porphyromonas sp. COT-239 OH1446]KGN70198.1 beta-hexosaminidase [Porphyromonas sp. COT-239 OH1446]